MIETLDDIVEQLADELGIYGSHGEPASDGQCECRVCFAMDLKERIERAFEVERILAAAARTDSKETPGAEPVASEAPYACNSQVCAIVGAHTEDCKQRRRAGGLNVR